MMIVSLHKLENKPRVGKLRVKDIVTCNDAHKNSNFFPDMSKFGNTLNRVNDLECYYHLSSL